MKKNKIKTCLIALSCLLLVGGGLTACNPEDPTPIVTITNGESANLEVGETLQLNVTLEHTDDAITYTSSNTGVATISNTGLITAVAKGEATITAEAGDITDTIKIIVTEPAVTVVDVESVTLNKTEITLDVGGTETLAATVLPENATDKTVTWETSNAEVATVANGVVTAVAKGEATITAKAGEKSATCKVTVTETDYSIAQITTANQTYTVRGEVVAENTGAILISDGEDALYIFSNSLPSQFELGDYVEATGKVESWNNAFQMSYKDTNLKVTKLENGPEITFPAPTQLTAEIANGWKTASEFTTSDIKEYTWTAVAGKAGSYDTFNIDGSDVDIEPVYLDTSAWKFETGKAYKVTAYFIGYLNYASIMLTDLEETTIPVKSITLTADKTEVSVGETVTLSATMSPNGASGTVSYSITEGSEFATLNGNVLTANAAGTVKVQASVGDVNSNEISITITAPVQQNIAVYDWTKGWEDGLTFDSDNQSTGMNGLFNYSKYFGSPANFKKLFEMFGSTETEITEFLMSGSIFHSEDPSEVNGIRIGCSNSDYDLAVLVGLQDASTVKMDLTTVHQIKSMTLKVIPCKTATTVSFSINDVKYKAEGTYDGTLNDAVDAKVELSTPTNQLHFVHDFMKNNQFILVGMTLEW